jgi:hypothetical protein
VEDPARHGAIMAGDTAKVSGARSVGMLNPCA